MIENKMLKNKSDRMEVFIKKIVEENDKELEFYRAKIQAQKEDEDVSKPIVPDRWSMATLNGPVERFPAQSGFTSFEETVVAL